MDSENEDMDDQPQFAKQGGDALNMDDEGGLSQNDSEEADPDDDDMVDPTKKASGSKPPADPAKDVKGEKLENQAYDLAVDVNDSEEIESDEEDDEVNMNDVQPASGAQAQHQPKAAAPMPARAPVDPNDDDEADDDKEVPGTYNPAEYANLQVSQDVKDIFEYIQRYKPQKIDLDTQLKPFIPDYVPTVGEVDACLKMPKPDGTKEDLGLSQLDEPALNCEDKTVLELKYVQSKNVVRAVPVSVDSIENADKKPKEVSRWINSVQDLHKTRPPPTVNYTKQMPDFDDVLMLEMAPEFEDALKNITFPGGEIDINPSDYARIVLTLVDIPVHKLANKKSLIESLHVLFTLFSTFRSNQHFQPKVEDGGVGGDLAGF